MSYAVQNMIPGSTVLWNGAQPCSQCGCKLQSKWDPTASSWVCAGCYNELAFEKGWETA
jgi:hypothetical protein